MAQLFKAVPGITIRVLLLCTRYWWAAIQAAPLKEMFIRVSSRDTPSLQSTVSGRMAVVLCSVPKDTINPSW